jgi:predicted Zn-dependent protease
VGNLPRAGCAVLSKTLGEKFRYVWVFFIIDAMVILPVPNLKISYEKNLFCRFTLKMRQFWKNYHEYNKFLGNLL